MRNCVLRIVFDNYKVDVKRGKKTVWLELLDTSGVCCIEEVSA